MDNAGEPLLWSNLEQRNGLNHGSLMTDDGSNYIRKYMSTERLHIYDKPPVSTLDRIVNS